jgi:hypothetical protein
MQYAYSLHTSPCKYETKTPNPQANIFSFSQNKLTGISLLAQRSTFSFSTFEGASGEL